MTMRKFCLVAIVVVAVFALTPSVARAQGAAKQGPDVVRDSDLEKDSLHNLEVAWQYFKLKKAYVAALQRCEEIIAGNPTFSKIDKALFIAGESNLYLSEGKGKQKASLYVRHEGNDKHTLTPEEFRNEARDYLSQLVNEYPDSKFREEALEDLKSLGGPKPKENKQ
jgi:outer membrane protein assembly factor BamD (BamD/ComL family)